MKFLTNAVLAAGVTAASFALPTASFAEYPEKPVSFVVPWPPGDLEDVLTRMIAEDFQAEYGVPAAVVNKPGGGGGPFPGAVEVATAAADGYTIGSFIIAVPVVGPNIGIPELSPNPFEPCKVERRRAWSLRSALGADKGHAGLGQEHGLFLRLRRGF